MNVVLSRNFASAFGLTLICSLLGSYLAGFPYLEVIGALVISLILGMLTNRQSATRKPGSASFPTSSYGSGSSCWVSSLT